MKTPRESDRPSAPPPGTDTPEAMARAAGARKPTTPSGHRVKLALTLILPHDVAEYVTARAIRAGKNVAGVVAEIPGAEHRRT